eukprot:TRINITY_DN38817_c0_g1_i1.p1 TRINITY_DN38817_c0_g1~~TRINITY_DN38817_c0_g1_i1.p1  ORF type:complete len:1155 (-),score=92.42 TRINITY_DN38817_c0_g1_i1:285-3749(-)
MSSALLSDRPPPDGISLALLSRLQDDGLDTSPDSSLMRILQSWGIRSLKQLSWTPPERLAARLDKLPIGSEQTSEASPTEGDIALLRALNHELWSSRKDAAIKGEASNAIDHVGIAPVAQCVHGNLLAAAAGHQQASNKLGRSSDAEREAIQIDCEARQAAMRMVGPSGRLLRNLLHSEFLARKSDRCFAAMLSHLPFAILVLASEQAFGEAWYSLLTRDVLNTSMLREDWAIRRAFMHGYEIPRCNLVSLYGVDGTLREKLLPKRPLSSDELAHPRIEAIRDPSPMLTTRIPCEVGQASLMPHVRGFQFMFNEFSRGVLDGVFDLPMKPGNHIFTAGGAVLACAQLWKQPSLTAMYGLISWESACLNILGRTKLRQSKSLIQYVMQFALDLTDARRKARAAFLPQGSTGKRESWGFASSDIDVFICTDNEEDGRALLRKSIQTICDNVTRFREKHCREESSGQRSSNIRLLRSANAVSIWCGWPLRTVQVMVILYKGMDEVLNFFDLDCICLGYNGRELLGLPRTLRALQTGFNFVEPAKLRRWSTGPRIIKYRKRGFGTVFFEICKHSPRCDLPSTLDEETARRIASLSASVSAASDFGYGEVELPFVSRFSDGRHLDEYIQMHEARRERRRQQVQAKSLGLWEPPDNDLIAGKYVYKPGPTSASDESIDALLDVHPEGGGLPAIRWKNTDLWESRRGNEFLPKCYMCRARIDPAVTIAERPRLCSACESLNEEKKQQAADLRGKVAIVTGGRVNIGYATTLRLLRLGCQVAVTTRFPKDCLRRFGLERDSNEWLDRLSVYGVDFRSIPAVSALGETFARRFERLDIFINNAAQTVRRPASHYVELVEAESSPLDARLLPCLAQAVGSDASALHATKPLIAPLQDKAFHDDPSALHSKQDAQEAIQRSTETPASSSTTAIAVSSVSVRQSPVEEPLDTRAATSWTSKLGDVSWVETLEVQLVNAMAPFTLLSALKPSLFKEPPAAGSSSSFPAAGSTSSFPRNPPTDPSLLLSPDKLGRAVYGASLAWRREAAQRMRFVINVTSQEGSFRSPGNKGPSHPHTNMAKASLNMLTCSAADEFCKEGVAVVSVDTGWISRMKPEPLAKAQAHVQNTPPLSAEDGAARVLDPILSALNGQQPLTGCLLRNFQPVDW